MQISEADQEAIEGFARTGQIIVGAMCAGIAAFGAIVVLLSSSNDPAGNDPAGGLPLISLLAVGFAVVMPSIGLFVSSVGVRSTVQPLQEESTGSNTQDSSQQWRGVKETLAINQTKMLVRVATLEGAAFFNLVAYMLESRWFSLVVATALFVLMVAHMPTVTRLRNIIEDKQFLFNQN